MVGCLSSEYTVNWRALANTKIFADAPNDSSDSLDQYSTRMSLVLRIVKNGK